jgi:hypothetical protein
MLKEGLASARAIAEVRNNPQTDELFRAIASDFETSDGRKRLQDGLRKNFKAPSRMRSRQNPSKRSNRPLGCSMRRPRKTPWR